jgi:hypothetical protein
MDAGTGDNLTQDGQHADAAMLDLDVTEAIESFLGGITAEQAKRIEETKRRLGTELILERILEGGGVGGLLRRSESGSGGKKGGNDCKLHLGFFESFKFKV